MKKRSPRAPSIPLDDAIERAMKIYQKEKRHPAPPDAVAQHLGYKNASNGAAASAIATLRYYGLIDRPDGKMISVSKDVESYMYAPNDGLKKEILTNWLKTPPVFSELLEQYQDQLPSDENLKFNLIQKGFLPEAADACLNVFRASVEFAGYYESASSDSAAGGGLDEDSGLDFGANSSADSNSVGADVARGLNPNAQAPVAAQHAAMYQGAVNPDPGVDRIPVRLSKGRRAWIEVPSPFYNADKKRLIAQIQLLLSDDEDEDEEEGLD